MKASVFASQRMAIDDSKRMKTETESSSSHAMSSGMTTFISPEEKSQHSGEERHSCNNFFFIFFCHELRVDCNRQRTLVSENKSSFSSPCLNVSFHQRTCFNRNKLSIMSETIEKAWHNTKDSETGDQLRLDLLAILRWW